MKKVKIQNTNKTITDYSLASVNGPKAPGQRKGIMKAQSACTSPLMAPKHRGRTWSDVPFVHCSIGAVNVYYIVFFPNSDSELKGSTSGQKLLPVNESNE